MAAKELYDYLTTVTPDYAATTLSVSPQRVITEGLTRNQLAYTADDDSEIIITLDNDKATVWIDLQWDVITESDAGTLLDFWADTAKANGMGSTFKTDVHPDSHTYIVRFTADFQRRISISAYYSYSCRLRVVGRIAD